MLAQTSMPRAASFDCAKASQPAERLICGDAALSSLDETMAAEYRRSRAAVSEEGRRQLRDNQRSWLKFVSSTCTTLKQSADAVQCMRDAYRERHDFLKTVPMTSGHLTFIPVESFGFRKAPGDDDWGLVPGWSVTLLRYPQIDAPGMAETRNWNAVLASRNAAGDEELERPRTETAEGDDTEIDEQESFTVHFASPDLISLSSEGYVYPHGAAHGTEGAQTSNYLLRHQRELSPADLFDPGRDWLTFLTARSFVDLAAQAERDQWTLDAATPAALANTVGNPQNWEITEKALTVRFPVYEVGPYSASMPKVEIRWVDLEPYLASRPTLQIPPR
ncbi:uncharacterized protein GGE65_000474 [Skermanella aerolata]|uniref:DUF3298 domain-containing protein n=1 Tax=Skermanella aerolata TaxID=393310 RepID=UPI003D259595